MSPQQITNRTYHLLPLKDDGSPDLPGEPPYIYLSPPTVPHYCIRFQIEGTSSICREGSLWVNIPPKGESFDRKKFHEYKLVPSFTKSLEIDVPVYCAGAFEFYCSYTPLPPFTTGTPEVPKPTRTKSHYIDVSPKLHVDDSPLPLDSLSVISVLSKFMGSYPEDFNRHLHGISERGYNMVHFTPLMVRGDSNSPYSIYDQHTFDKTIFPKGEAQIEEMVKNMEYQLGLLSLTDVVWNHTANNSKWLEEHPESGYNIKTAPHLQPAYELDSAFLQFSSRLKSLGLPTKLNNTDDLLRIMDGAKIHVIGSCKLWEFYVCDAEKDALATVSAWTNGHIDFDGNVPDDIASWQLKEKANWIRNNCCPGTDRMGERFRRRVVPERGAALLQKLFGRYNSQVNSKADERAAYGTMHKFLNELNLDWYKEYDNDVAAIMEQVFNRTKYMRLEDNGPKIGEITIQNPLIETYFTRLPVNETTSKHDPDELALANNGWVWAADVMRDNAGPKSKVYLRRELIVWGDCVKLRYGSGPEDSPFLWKFMTEYTQLMAKHFHGFRIDNCHSTPLHVASHMLDAARHVQPNLVVAAELFSGDEKMDFLYCQKLGISFLIREAMQCWSTAEMSKLVHINSGRPIGSFEVDDISGTDKPIASEAAANGSTPQGREITHKIIPSKIHALLMDCTHDNETPVQRRDGRDTLPTSALVAMCASASGSVFGMDELYPQLVELVHEPRHYTSPYSNGAAMKVGPSEGTGGIKRLMNQLHTIMGKDGYDESFVHHEGEYITVHRLHPKSRKGYYLIAHTAYPGYGNGNAGFGPQWLTGTKAKLLGAWNLEVDQSEEAKKAAANDKVLRGVPSKTKDLRGVTVEARGDDTVISVPSMFPPGSIAIFETWIPGAEHSEGLDKYLTTGARQAFKDCNLNDINAIMYRADSEEHAMSHGADGVYTVPGIGPLVYCGLQGWWSVLREVVNHNDLGHPICNHLREGQWALDYIVGRLDKLVQRQDGIYKNLAAPAEWLRQRCDAIRNVPSFLLPRCFALIIRTAKKAAHERAIEQMHPNIQHGQRFLKSLAMVSCQVQGYMDNAKLWPDKLDPSLAAGLPHFAQDWARVWGRDVMIAMRGLLTCTGRYDEAKEHLLAFASIVKHGMIPNLVNSGKLPRYNSRDSVWFFLQNIQDFVALAPKGSNFLQERVRRRFLPYKDDWFPHDDSRAYSQTSSIEDVIQECLQRHASGMHFREYNAGSDLDSQMKSEGFNIDVEVDWNNGIIYGGNEWNCGTWMDKMGDSAKAGNKGHPGTSRDGAPVEITGLLFSCLHWVDGLKSAGKFKYDGVTKPDGTLITYGAWAAKIRSSFEHHYYVPADPAKFGEYDVDPKIVNRKGIYKDVHRCKKEYRDYQLRPNFPIAMVVAPELFDPAHAIGALEIADKYLRGPTGMATLDPGDMEYHPDYINSDDSDNYQTAHGRNYHQGPEWLWPTGFFLRALLKFDLKRRKTKEERVEAFQQVTQRLNGCRQMIHDSPWRGLTELTNRNGSYCGDSCPTQAWSAGCIIDLYDDASRTTMDMQ